jgi:hypothetical protein
MCCVDGAKLSELTTTSKESLRLCLLQSSVEGRKDAVLITGSTPYGTRAIMHTEHENRVRYGISADNFPRSQRISVERTTVAHRIFTNHDDDDCGRVAYVSVAGSTITHPPTEMSASSPPQAQAISSA